MCTQILFLFHCGFLGWFLQYLCSGDKPIAKKAIFVLFWIQFCIRSLKNVHFETTKYAFIPQLNMWLWASRSWNLFDNKSLDCDLSFSPLLPPRHPQAPWMTQEGGLKLLFCLCEIKLWWNIFHWAMGLCYSSGEHIGHTSKWYFSPLPAKNKKWAFLAFHTCWVSMKVLRMQP